MISQSFTAFLFVSTLLAGAPPTVRSVAVPGTNLQVNLATQVGQPFDEATVSRDVRYLWALGRFQDIRVTTVEHGSAADVVFRVVREPQFTLREIRLRPSTFGVRMTVTEGALFTRPGVHALAMQAQRQLNDRGYPNARVTDQLTPAERTGKKGAFDLVLTIDPGDGVRVGEVVFTGDTALAPSELRDSLRALRARRILPKWRLLPAYTPAAVDSDVARLHSLYVFKGYFDATVRASEEMDGNEAHIRIDVHTGPLYREIDRSTLCTGLFAARRESERQGILDMAASLNVGDGDGDVERVPTLDRGRAYVVRRIDFLGHPHYTDAAIRSNFVLQEGTPLDTLLLRRSLARLNRAMMFESVDERQVSVQTDDHTGTVDITVHLTERKRGAWNLSGPAGPLSLAGPLRASIGGRLPAWGQGFLELATYTASFNLFAFSRSFLPLLSMASSRSVFPVLALERPFTPGEGWLGGFALTPQLSRKASVLSYASTQLQQRLQAALAGDRGLTPDLQVTVRRTMNGQSSGDTALICEPPKPRFAAARTAAGFGLHLLGAIPGI